MAVFDDDTVLLISSFGDDGRGGLFAFDGDALDRIDDLSTTGLAFDGARVARLLRAAADYDSVAELLIYDARGVLEYRRLDALGDPHDISAHPSGWLMVSSAQNAVMVLEPDGKLVPTWQPTRVHDAFHPNCLAVVDGETWVTVFGRFTHSREWASPASQGAGFLLNLDTGEELGGLTHPHSPRYLGGSWLICESLDSRVVRIDAHTGDRRTAIELDGYTRGLAHRDGVVYVGESGGRDGIGDRDASFARCDLATGTVLERVAVPAREVYDLVFVPRRAVDGLRRGFDTNLQRVAERAVRATDALFSPNLGSVEGLGLALPVDACGIRLECAPGSVFTTGQTAIVPVRVENVGRLPLATVPPYPVFVSCRWFDDTGQQRDGARAPLGTLLAPGGATVVDVPMEAPRAPGRYRLAISLVQEHAFWFDDLDARNGWHGDVDVLAAAGDPR